MTDEQIIVLHRGIGVAANRGEYREEDGFNAMVVGDSISENIWMSLRQLAERQPDRVKRIVEKCANSDIEEDWDLPANAVSGLVDQDYPFVRDTLIRFITDRSYGTAIATDGAERAAEKLIRDRLTDGQIADFNYHYILAGGEDELRAADPNR
ncbi:hypothetical protein NWFMUON74_56410 [Nocardia wallacei]|uniref:Uncharacterized protein n=2 Tax=Nocardia wallacei TaxID=480035 RepID=A0A7G1KV61_9NOCA|nr:hypothetical protein NWFMUON74_56410 [Nocardia wallacei]